MGSVLPLHREKVLKHLRALDPVQVRLTQRLTQRKPHRLVQFFYSSVQALHYWRQRRATIQALKGLPDWQLADIGVQREAISAAVDQALQTRSQAARNRLAA